MSTCTDSDVHCRHRGIAYDAPYLDGNVWVGWIEGYGETTYGRDHLIATERDAEARLLRHIDAMLAASRSFRSRIAEEMCHRV